MASLQERLDAAFGALSGSGDSGAAAPAWRPSAQQVFRSGAAAANDGNSSDEEYEEKARRETMPGLAAALVEEDEPDAEGFRPSTAFCRALDAEEEYNEVDEVATGLWRSVTGGDALPPRDMQVLEDNPYEERAAAQAAAAAAAAGGGQQPASMEVEEAAEAEAGAGGAPAAAAAPGEGGEEAAGGGEKKKVRFAGYVPPSRRPGYEMRCTELPPEAGAQQAPRRQQRGQGLSRVPDHVAHPEKYTCYVLDEPLVVGGGVGQLAGGDRNVHDRPPAAAAEAGEALDQDEEPERWEGPVGAGAVQFRSRQQRAGAAAAPDGAGAAAARRQGAAQLQRAYEDEAAGEAEEEAQMEEDAAAVPAAAKPRGQKRSYRSSRPAAADDAV